MGAKFEIWWKDYWRRNGMPEIMNLAFKEVAKNAWDAATEEMISRQTNKTGRTMVEFFD